MWGFDSCDIVFGLVWCLGLEWVLCLDVGVLWERGLGVLDGLVWLRVSYVTPFVVFLWPR